MTDSEAHRPLADDPQASLRAELLTPLLAGQAVLEAAIAELANADPALRSQLNNQLSFIVSLSQQVSTAPGGTLRDLKAEVANLASNAIAAAQEARTSGASASSAADSVTLARAAREQVNTVMAGMKDFDPYLQFGPGDTEADYRKREEERRAYITAEQAKGTPQGDLNASAGAIGQMADAKAHGADASPDFQKRADDLIHSTEQLRAQIIREGGSTKEFDDKLRDDLRGIMRKKGMTDAEIDAKLAENPDPLAAAKAYLDEKDVDAIKRGIKDSGRTNASVVAANEVAPEARMDVSSAMAELRAAGVSMTSPPADADPSHGLTVATPAPIAKGRGAA